MRTSNLFLLFALLFGMSAIGQIYPENDSVFFTLKVGNLEFTVDSAHGAKVASFKIDGNEYLVNTEREIYGLYQFWGSTAWIGPEAEGNWPPWEKIDNKPYQTNINDTVMTFTSEVDWDKYAK